MIRGKVNEARGTTYYEAIIHANDIADGSITVYYGCPFVDII